MQKIGKERVLNKVKGVTVRTMKHKSFLEIPKSSTFTDSMVPDGTISSHEKALANEDNIIRTPRILKEGSFSWTLPEPRKEYRYLTSSQAALRDLGLLEQAPDTQEYRDIVSGAYYTGNDKFKQQGLPFPYAQAYAGWQFGVFAGQLGDGRVINLFEVPKNLEDRANRDKYEFQLKGAGKTPYSRFADGKAVLRSSIREYIISEHLNAIGIPTTRALSLTYLPKTYAQRHKAEKCAIVSRFAELWVRLGSFDLHRWRSDRDEIRRLADYVIKELFTIQGEKFASLSSILSAKAELLSPFAQDIGELTDYDKMYYETIIRNARGTAKWQAYGFLNGVLNTDNTSILGFAIDFGPFSIMDRFDPNYTPNSEDHESRYGFRNTPTAIWWNLTRLGENLAELIGAGPELISDTFFKEKGIKKEWEDRIIKRATKVIEAGGEIYQYAYVKEYTETLFKRLGLSTKLIDLKDPEALYREVIDPLLDILGKIECDYNKFFLGLQNLSYTDSDFLSKLTQLLIPNEQDFYDKSKYAKDEIDSEIKNWVEKYKDYAAKSNDLGSQNESAKYNPLFLPRNWILDEVIEFTEDSNAEDLSYLKKLERMSFYPFESDKWGDDLKHLEEKWLVQGDVGESRSMLQCSCSS